MIRLNCCALLLLACVLTGCQSTAPSSNIGRSVTAGKTVFVEVPGGQGPSQIIAYTPAGQTVCPECRSVAADYFKTGVLSERVCKTCGATFSAGQGQFVSP